MREYILSGKNCTEVGEQVEDDEHQEGQDVPGIEGNKVEYEVDGQQDQGEAVIANVQDPLIG